MSKDTPTPDFEQALAHHQLINARLDRILWITLPILSFMISMICANLNFYSLFGTFLVLCSALIAVSIKKISLFFTGLFVLIYVFVDNYLSFGQTLNTKSLQFQLGSMMSFIVVFGLGRPYIHRIIKEKTNI